jgi:hypothetical protein
MCSYRLCTVRQASESPASPIETFQALKFNKDRKHRASGYGNVANLLRITTTKGGTR